MGGTVLDVRVAVGDVVQAGDGLVVVSAMKMESTVTAPCSGTVVAVAELAVGATVAVDDVVVVIEPSDGAGPSTVEVRREDTWLPVLDDVAKLQGLALARLAPGSEDPGVVRQRNRGKLTCRERIAELLDAGSFREVGSLAGFASYDDDGRIVAVHPGQPRRRHGARSTGAARSSAPTTSPPAAATPTGPSAPRACTSTACRSSCCSPSIRLLDGSSGGGSVAAMVPEQQKSGESTAQESTGAITAGRPRVSGGGGSFLTGHLGVEEYAQQLATVPVVNVLLGSVVGIGAAKAVLGHFSVMVRDISQLFVAGPPVVSHAMGYDITKEDLGGWQVHCRNGSVDNLAETEEEALAMTRRFLSYLPSSVHETPPVLPPSTDDPADRRDEELLTLIPRKRTTTFDVRRSIDLLVDQGSFFEIGALWGTDQVVGLARLNGHPVGVFANDSRHANGGAMTADGCDKFTRHLDLCDLFHLPILNLVDNPGFCVGLEHEIAGTIRKGADVDGRLLPDPRAAVHRADAPQLRRGRQLPVDAGPRAARPGHLAGGRPRRHPARGRHRGGVQAPARRGRRSGGAARRDQRAASRASAARSAR